MGGKLEGVRKMWDYRVHNLTCEFVENLPVKLNSSIRQC